MFEFLSNLLSGGGQNTKLPINQNTMPQMSPDQWNNNPASLVGKTGGFGSSVNSLLNDPNFQSFLAGTGAGLDPEGVGGAIGNAAKGMIQNRQMGKAMEKQDKRWKNLMELLGGSAKNVTIRQDGKGGTTMSLDAAENSLGSMHSPLKETNLVDPMENLPKSFTEFLNNMGIDLPGGL